MTDRIEHIEVQIYGAKYSDRQDRVHLLTKQGGRGSYSFADLGAEDLAPHYEVQYEDQPVQWLRLRGDWRQTRDSIRDALWARVDLLPVPEYRCPVESQHDRIERESFTQYGERI